MGQLFQLLQLSGLFLFRTSCQIPWLRDSCSSCCSCLIYFCLEPVVRSLGCGQLLQLLQLSDIFLFLEPVVRSLGCGTAVPAAPAVWFIPVYNRLPDPLAVGQLFQLLQLSNLFLFRTGCQIPWLWDSCSSCCSCLIYFCLEPVVRSLGCGAAVPAAAAV